MFRAQEVHRAHHAPTTVQLSRLISIKTGGCPEDCGYCPQAKRYHTGVADEALLDLDTVVAAASAAKAEGATRFCMGAAWRGPKDRDLQPVLAMVREVKALGLETCCTLGMLKEGQAGELKSAGLDYYNHNLDTSAEFYGEVITTRGYQDRLDTLLRVRAAGINVCCGGIVGMGESRAQRAGLVAQLANMDPYPESVPINHLVQVAGNAFARRARRAKRARSVRVRAYDRGGPNHHAEGDGAALGRPARAGRGRPGAVLSRRRQFDLSWRQAPDDGERRRGCRPVALRQTGTDARHVTLIADLERDLGALDTAGLKRKRRTLESATGARVEVDGRRLIAFASNDYLGLANHPDVVAAARDGAARWGAGAGASHLVCGHFAPHAALEAELAAFVRPTAGARALTFSSGYLANLAILTALAGRSDAIFADRLNHACLNDGALLSRAEFIRYPHGDVAALARRLAASKAKRKVIATDAVFSMDGDIAPLPAMLALAEEFDAWLVVDDAHGFGVLGEGDAGAAARSPISASSRTGSCTWARSARRRASRAPSWPPIPRSSRRSSSPRAPISSRRLRRRSSPRRSARACGSSPADHARRAHLFDLVARFRERMHALPWALRESRTPIQPLVVGANAAAVELAGALWDRGFWVPAIRPPTVPVGTARLRITLTAAHTRDDVDALVDALADLAPGFGGAQ